MPDDTPGRIHHVGIAGFSYIKGGGPRVEHVVCASEITGNI